MPDLNWIMGNIFWILALLVSLAGFVWLTKRALSAGRQANPEPLPDEVPPNPAS